MAVTLFYISFIFPVRISFYNQNTIFDNVMEFIISFIFILDVLVCFNRVHYDENWNYIIQRKQICLSYLKGWFFVDFISAFPLKFLINENLVLLQAFKILKFRKIFFVTKIYKLFTNFQKKMTGNENPYFKIDFLVDSSSETIFKEVIGNIILIHYITCFAYVIPVTFSPDNNWILERGLEGFSRIHKYLFSLHWVIETFITVGYGENTLKYIIKPQYNFRKNHGHHCDGSRSNHVLFHNRSYQ